jgi:uroporphyrinogen-III synthase
MAQPLENITVAVTEHRYTKEFAALFERVGATVYACPVLEERKVENRSGLQSFIQSACSGKIDVMIFLTGVGARFLIAEADSMGMKASFLAALDKGVIVVRGPKPVAALRQFGVRIDVIPQTPTTEGVIEALEGRDLNGRNVGVQLYGTPNPKLVSALESRGAKVTPVHIYDYGAIADPDVVNKLVTKLLNGEIQVIAFTSAPQVRVLFDLADQLGIADSLDRALNNVVIASIGEVTSRALQEKGLRAKIVPSQSKMAALAQAVADFFSKNPSASGGMAEGRTSKNPSPSGRGLGEGGKV